MIRQENLNFSTNAKLGKLIGRELITNNIIAVFELIKNSYDAFATEVVIEFVNFLTTGKDADLLAQKNEVISSASSEIIISDNGEGMSYQDVKSKWMQIGTTSKENSVTRIKSVGRSGSITRVINGEKGIGRFGTDRIGARLIMSSVGGSGTERTQVIVDWNAFNNHQKLLQEIPISCTVESLPSRQDTGVSLQMTNLRDHWTATDIINLKKQLKKMISPFAQEKREFTILLKFGENFCERVENDSFEYASISLTCDLAVDGTLTYLISEDLKKTSNILYTPVPSFGPVNLKILYMDAAAKRAFAKRNLASTREYGNIKVFRDDFRILPYGEMENDWLGIDNKHAQAVFRTLGTRDIIGYVQITKQYNPMLKDATNRQGLNEDTKEFEDFKAFIWKCLEILQDYVFIKIKDDAEKQGKIIQTTVHEIRDNFETFQRTLPKLIESTTLPQKEKAQLLKETLHEFQPLQKNLKQVEQANKQLSSRLVVMEKIVGTESTLYDILHAIKNKLDALTAAVDLVESQAVESGIAIDRSVSHKAINEISKMVYSALKRTAPTRKKREVLIAADLVGHFIEEQILVYPHIDFRLEVKSQQRIRCDADGLRSLLDNLLSNSIKALKEQKMPLIHLTVCSESDNLVLYFEDNGNGIPPEIAPFIFNVSFSGTGGTGIGLSTAYQYMKEQKGNISLIKSGKLGGALFKIVFPPL